MTPTFATFEAWAAALRRNGPVRDPEEGEAAGSACAVCGVVPRYRADAQGRFRIEMIHDAGRHKAPPDEPPPDLEPPERTDDW